MQITADSFASLQFTIGWESGEARHTEHILAQKANLWRDQFPPRRQRTADWRPTGPEHHSRIRTGRPPAPP
ncbi:hypothetical protein Dret_1319 [Desulfohalobium retbaense DSM 5692]|uniref:Uncharacterized protein n=1 Tax=Desulfohalobium retbaense (strain ATCC 49708 / DSM 5692 / JCM 16813 / HR100) TaxID=485915 RepID=C8X2G0_DESRD|nr:hypothetical protein Dret_1319 [Desulfohalobium retbaense DSM 5692]